MKKILLIISFCSLSTIMCLAQAKPNIVLFVSDDHGMDALGSYGNNVIQTPALDELAREGVRFTNAYSTCATCSSSRSTILTGKFSHSTGHYGHAHSFHHFSTFDSETSLPVILEENGYRTARIGKYHLAPEKVYHFQNALKGNWRNGVEMTDYCKDFIFEESEDPFFLYFCTADPHRSDTFTDDPYHPDAFGNIPEGYQGISETVYSPDDVIIPSFLPTSNESRAELAQYYQSVSRMDQGFGYLINALKKAGKYDNTLIIYISDNGIAFPGAKTNLYEAGVNLPCIIKATDSKTNAGMVSETNISWVDLAPTIIDYVGIKTDVDFHGRSFVNELKHPDLKNNQVLFGSQTFHEVTMYYPMRSIRKDDYKLIVNFANALEFPCAMDLWISPTWQQCLNSGNGKYAGRQINKYLFRPRYELYNIANDPDEINNLASDLQYSEILEDLINDLKKWQEETNDPWFIKWSHE